MLFHYENISYLASFNMNARVDTLEKYLPLRNKFSYVCHRVVFAVFVSSPGNPAQERGQPILNCNCFKTYIIWINNDLEKNIKNVLNPLSGIYF